MALKRFLGAALVISVLGISGCSQPTKTDPTAGATTPATAATTAATTMGSAMLPAQVPGALTTEQHDKNLAAQTMTTVSR